ncbi:ECF-type sigma factor [Streptomyces noursei]|uniref:ECF-type sigma factor n=1 Tax=Streptomyces noursei TaxID=1971 RepID=UPI0033D83B65
MRQLSGGGDDSGEAHRRLSKVREAELMEEALRAGAAVGLEYLELLESVKTAIADERQAAVWELTHVWGLKGIEIAELLEISSATVSRELAAAEAGPCPPTRRPKLGTRTGSTRYWGDRW